MKFNIEVKEIIKGIITDKKTNYENEYMNMIDIYIKNTFVEEYKKIVNEATEDMKNLLTLEIWDISLGKLVLSGNNDKNVWLCFSSSKDDGVVNVYDTLYPTSLIYYQHK